MGGEDEIHGVHIQEEETFPGPQSKTIRNQKPQKLPPKKILKKKQNKKTF